MSFNGSRKRRRGRKKFLLGLAAGVVATFVTSLIVQNLSSDGKAIAHDIEPLYPSGSRQFNRVMGHMLGPPIVSGNEIKHLENGNEIFPAMLEAIEEAQETICFETFIFWEGAIADRFSQALSERARNGVRVHVLLDWVGSEVNEQLIEAMTDAGVQVERYHPVHWYSLDRVNKRTHRKILVVDGRIGFTGGVGIADQWQGDAEDPEHWRDSHFRVEGPVVAQMQAAFMDNWLKTRATVLHSEDYFPPLEPAGEMDAQTFKSSSREGGESARLMVLLSIAAAREEILIGNAYFVPDDLVLEALKDAAERGIRIRIVVPGPNIDTDVTRRASRSRWGPLLDAGIEIFEYQPTMYHTKILVIDREWASVGSINFDNRSFRLNDEANLNVLDRAFAREMTEVFHRDLERSRRVTPEEWRNRPLTEKLTERLAGLLRSQL